MNHKKSMRIFWLSLCLLLIAGTAIIAAMQYRSHKKEAENQPGGHENRNQALRTADGTGAGRDEKTEDAPSLQDEGFHAQQEGTADSTQLKPTSGSPAAYRFELKVRNGYLDVYHYHTENLFFHTGIPYGVLTAKQRQELQDGKYFLNEQELYGYLESCTS